MSIVFKSFNWDPFRVLLLHSCLSEHCMYFRAGWPWSATLSRFYFALIWSYVLVTGSYMYKLDEKKRLACNLLERRTENIYENVKNHRKATVTNLQELPQIKKRRVNVLCVFNASLFLTRRYAPRRTCPER